METSGHMTRDISDVDAIFRVRLGKGLGLGRVVGGAELGGRVVPLTLCI